MCVIGVVMTGKPLHSHEWILICSSLFSLWSTSHLLTALLSDVVSGIHAPGIQMSKPKPSSFLQQTTHITEKEKLLKNTFSRNHIAFCFAHMLLFNVFYLMLHPANFNDLCSTAFQKTTGDRRRHTMKMLYLFPIDFHSKHLQKHDSLYWRHL